jgi:hypothetical protein
MQYLHVISCITNASVSIHEHLRNIEMFGGGGSDSIFVPRAESLNNN